RHTRFSRDWSSDVCSSDLSSALPGLTWTQQLAAVKEYYVSANVLKASEDKTFPGAVVASMASPWGQAVAAGDPANTYFGSYRERSEERRVGKEGWAVWGSE